MLDNATRNLALLRQNPYPGRGIVIGMDSSAGHLVQVYWIMGRSENSRNRVFVFVDDVSGAVRTAPADPAKVKDPSLIIYDAMLEGYGWKVATNGHQTESVIRAAMMSADDMVFERTMNGWGYEPDAPNFTPRISAAFRSGQDGARMAIIRRVPWGDGIERCYFEYSALLAGFGYCLTTYSWDGDPLPSFRGEPYLLPLAGCEPAAVAQAVWDALNAENRIAIAVKFIPRWGGPSRVAIVNRFTAVS